MEGLFLLAFLPLLAFGILGSDDDRGDDQPDAEDPTDPDIPVDPRNQILRDDDDPNARSGGDGEDLILGAGGADTLSGNAGMDAISGETGPDQIFGGNGDDLLLGAWGQDQISGGAGADLLLGGSGDDFLVGGEDDDFLAGSSGQDTLDGGAGDDDLIGVDARADLGMDEINGFDLEFIETQLRTNLGSALTQSDVQRVSTGILNADPAEGGIDWLYGGGGDDFLVGDNGDVMLGGEGQDQFEVFHVAGDDAVTLTDYDPAREALQLLAYGHTSGVLSYRDDAFLDGVELLLDGEVVAYLEGVRANQINPDLLSLTMVD